MRAIIGPNGAGKTTMMDCITGKTRPDEGDIYFGGNTDLTKLDEADIAELGIGRKFQKPTVFENHTVETNILLALKAPRSAFATLFGKAADNQQERIDAILKTIRLTEHRNRPAADLSHGQKQWLEIGMLLAQDPKLLLVDEPVAGMTDAETQTTAELLREIAKDPFGRRRRARHAFRARTRRQGHGAARRRGAGRGLARRGQRRPAGDRGVSGAVRRAVAWAAPLLPLREKVDRAAGARRMRGRGNV